MLVSCRTERSDCSCGIPRARQAERRLLNQLSALLLLVDSQERFRSLIPSYIRDSSGAIVVMHPAAIASICVLILLGTGDPTGNH